MEAKIVGENIVITMRLTKSKDAKLSSTGKSKMLATTGGYIPVEGEGGMKFSVNVIEPAKK